MGKAKIFLAVTKPRVTIVNALTAVSGYLFAAGLHGAFSVSEFLAVTFGVTLVIASACALNNLLDRDIDVVMARTKTRPSVTGEISRLENVVLATILGVVGFGLLIALTNIYVVLLGILGYVTYVVFYGMLAKRKSIHSTLVGSVSGAIPILAGYMAVTGKVDLAGAILFMILFFWQEPAFYSISIFRRKEYEAAEVPVMAVIVGEKNTARQIFVYTVLYVAASLSLVFFGYVGITYLIIVSLLGVFWLYLGMRGLRSQNLEAWSRRMFRLALITMIIMCTIIPLGPLLP